MDNDIILLQSASSSVGVCVSEMWVMRTEQNREDERQLQSFFNHFQIFFLKGNVTVTDPYLVTPNRNPEDPGRLQVPISGTRIRDVL